MPEMILHPKTQLAIERFCSKPSHALLVMAPKGFGKSFIAQNIVAQALGIKPGQVGGYAYGSIVTAEGSSIGIEQIRELIKTMKLKTPGHSALQRYALIDTAERMTAEAQNALLKLLEEPPQDTMLVLTAADEHGLLETIRSRVQTLRPVQPDMSETIRFFTAKYPAKSTAEIQKEYNLSGGLPGLMDALLAQDESHPLFSAVATAKSILEKSMFERLAAIDTLAKQKDTLPDVLFALQQITNVSLLRAAQAGRVADIKRWHGIGSCISEAQEALKSSVQTKLLLTNLMLNL